MRVIPTILLICLSINNLFAQCGNIEPNLGNDTLVCQGQSLILNPGAFNSYLWDNNSTGATRAVNQTGTYWVRVGTTQFENNLIVNGDFEQGNTGFTTGYTYSNTSTGSYGILSAEGRYTITSSPSLAHDNFLPCTDQTPAPGTQMMIVNGANSPTNVWCQTVNVNPDTDYYFGTWVSNALNDANVAQLQFSINNTSIGSVFSPSATGCDWSQFFQIWNSGINTTANICILNQNTNISGNDFMIDDITFTTICYDYDTINVTSVPSPVISVTPNDSICAGETSSIIASSTNPGLTYTWNPGNIQSNELNVSPLSSAFYNVTGVDANGCVSNLISRLVYVSPSPSVNLAASQTTICHGESVTLSATSPNPNITYAWGQSTETTPQITVSPTTSTQYTVQVTNTQNCSGYDTVQIIVIPPYTLSFSGNTTICQGDSTQLTVSGSIPQMQFIWEGTTPGSQLTVGPISDTYFVATGSFLNCPQVTDSVLVTVNQIPTIIAPADLQICKGESFVATAITQPVTSTIHWSTGPTGPSQTFVAVDDEYIYIYAENLGCISPTDSFFVDVLLSCSIEVPNVFTPNKDEVNDSWTLITADGIETLDCTILNRWGNVIRTFNQVNFSWDGRDESGNEVVEGVYFYHIVGKTVGGEGIDKHGFVTLER